MTTNTNFITVPGDHRVQLFSKTETTHTGQATYSLPAKEAIASQFYNLLRDISYNQTRASRVLAKAHDIAPATVLKWVKLHGDTLSTPTPKVGQVKPKTKPADKSVSEGSVSALIQGVALIPQLSVLDKLLEVMKAVPSIDITISVRPTK